MNVLTLLQQAKETQRKILELPEERRSFGFLIQIPDDASLEDLSKILSVFGNERDLKCAGTQELTRPGTFLMFVI